MSQPYQPPYVITTEIVNLVAEICQHVGVISANQPDIPLKLRHISQIRSVHGSLAIEGNTLSEEQIAAVLDGKTVLAPPREILEAKNALTAYERFQSWQPLNQDSLLEAHRVLMSGLDDEAGAYRRSGVGVLAGEQVVHMAPPASRVYGLMSDLFDWLAHTDEHPLIASSVFHYEFEFIHPFMDGNGRMGRLWQNVILASWNPIFAHVPVESLILQHQHDYYEAIRTSTKATDIGIFVAFMLRIILSTLTTVTPQDTPQVTPQVQALVGVLTQEMGRDELMLALGLSDRKSFRERYLQPALAAGLIEYTIPDKPTSRNQRYRKRWGVGHQSPSSYAGLG